MAEPVFTVVNIEETPDKIVGKRRAPKDPFSLEGNRKKDAYAWQQAMPVISCPKGVYRFKTHEEADEWERKMISRRRKS